MARPREVSDEAILDAARRVFLEQGPSVATSVIAKELGVSAPALFHRFGNKRSLMIAALRPKKGPDLLDGYDPERSLEDQLNEIASGFISFFMSMAREMSTLRAAGITHAEIFQSYGGDPPPIVTLQRVAGFFREAQEHGVVRVEDPVSLAIAFMGGVQAPNFLRMTCGLAAPEQCAPERHLPVFVAIFARGVTLENP